MANKTTDSSGSSADLEELSRFVAAHPDDYAQRWRLAKKLYMAWEYTEAIKHLLILKKSWTRKLNVLRYLAATYYRLGKYEESISELREILQQWPSETAVWEQLARVLEIADRPEDAAQAWEQVLHLDPHHPIAGRAVARLRSTRPVTPRDKLRLNDSDSGIHINRGMLCPSCGAQNSAEFERCWQCHGILQQSPIPDVDQEAPPAPPAPHWGRTLLGGLATVAALSLAVHVTITYFNLSQTDTAPTTVYAVLAHSLFASRLVICGVLLLAWPAALWLAARIVRAPRPSKLATMGASLFLACSCYDLMWLPVKYLFALPIAMALLSFLAVAAMQRISLSHAFQVWLGQGVLACAVALAVMAIQVGPAPIVELLHIVRAAEAADSGVSPGTLEVGNAPVPKTWTLVWDSTGSEWLDAQAAMVTVEVEADPQGALLSVGLHKDGQFVYYADAPPYRFTTPVAPNVTYELAVRGAPDATATLSLYGVLRPRVDP